MPIRKGRYAPPVHMIRLLRRARSHLTSGCIPRSMIPIGRTFYGAPSRQDATNVGRRNTSQLSGGGTPLPPPFNCGCSNLTGDPRRYLIERSNDQSRFLAIVGADLERLAFSIRFARPTLAKTRSNFRRRENRSAIGPLPLR
jgi:hypothetical protein